MSWDLAQLRGWIDATLAVPDGDHAQVLGVRGVVPELALTQAFHRLADAAHPDRWRFELPAAELTRLVRAYSRVTLAYATLRERNAAERARRAAEPAPVPSRTITLPRTQTSPLPPAPGHATPPRTSPPRTSPPGPAVPRTVTQQAGAAGVDATARADAYLAASEAALGAGDLAGAQLNLRLAVASAPGAAKYRQALADLDRIIAALR